MAPRIAAAFAALVLFAGLLGGASAARPLLLEGSQQLTGLRAPKASLASQLRRLGELLGYSTGTQLAQQQAGPTPNANDNLPDAPVGRPSPFQYSFFETGEGYYAAVSGSPRNLGEQAVPTLGADGSVQLSQQQAASPDAPAGGPSPFQFNNNAQDGDGYYAAISGQARTTGN
jgi:hypothetical protein